MTNQPAVQEPTAAPAIAISGDIMQEVMGGNLERLTPAQRVELHNAVCASVGLNPLTHPFDFIHFPARRGEAAKTILYPNATAFSQLTAMHKLSIDFSPLHEDQERGLMIQWCSVTDGVRAAKDMAVISTEGRRQDGSTYKLTGQAYGDAMMKVMTKARRRAVSAFCGLPLNGFGGGEDDDPEGGRIVTVDADGVITSPEQPAGALNEPGPGRPSPLARLQQRVEQEDIEWVEFLDILGVSGWDQWLAQGETPGSAWSAYEEYKEGRAAPVEDEIITVPDTMVAEDASRAESASRQTSMDEMDDLYPPSGDGH